MIEKKSETVAYLEPLVEEVKNFIQGIQDGELMDIEEYETFIELLKEMLEGLPEFKLD